MLHTPVWIIACAQLVRLAVRLIRFAVRHPVADLIVAALALAWRYLGWPGAAALAGGLTAAAVSWRLACPAHGTADAAGPMRARWRRWHYKRSWAAVMTISRLAVPYRGRRRDQGVYLSLKSGRSAVRPRP